MAESEKLTSDDIIQDNALKPTIEDSEKLLANVNLLIAGFKNLLKASEKVFNGPRKIETAEDIEKLNEELKKSQRAREGLSVAQKEAIKLEERLAKLRSEEAINNEKIKIQISEQAKANKQAAREKLGLVGIYDRESRRLNELRKQYKDVAVSQGINSKAARQLAKDVNTLDKSLKDVDASVGQHNRNIGNYTSALTMLPGRFGQVASSVKDLSGQFVRLLANPIVLFIVALTASVVALVKAFKNTDTGALAFEKIMGRVTATVDVILQRLGLLASGIIDFFSGDFTEGKEKITRAFADITDQIKEANAASDEYLDTLDAIEEAETAFINTRAANNKRVAQLKFTAADKSLSIPERRAALQEAIKLSKEEFALDVRFAKEKFDAQVKNQAARIGVEEKFLRDFLALNGDQAAAAVDQDTRARKIREFNAGETEKLLEDLLAAQISADQKFFEENKRAISTLSSLKDEEFELLQKEKERENKFIESETQKQLAAEELRFEAEFRDAQKNNENLISVVEAHEKNKEKIISDAFKRAQEEANKQGDEKSKQVEEDLTKELKQLEKQQEAIQKTRILLTKEGSKERLGAEIENILEAREIELLNAHLTEDERVAIFLEAEEKIKKLKADFRKEELQKTIAQTQAIADVFDSELTKRDEREKKLLDQEIKRRDDAIEKQQERAEKGLENTLAFEIAQREQAELRKKELEEREARRKEAQQLAEAYLQAYISELNQPGSNPQTAAFKALGDVLLAKALGLTLAGAFKDGVENLEGPGTGTSDSLLIRASKGESVIKADATAENPGLASAWNSGLLNEYLQENWLPKYLGAADIPSGDTIVNTLLTTKLISEVEGLRDDLNKRPVYRYDINRAMDVIEEAYKNGVKQTTILKNRKTWKGK